MGQSVLTLPRDGAHELRGCLEKLGAYAGMGRLVIDESNLAAFRRRRSNRRHPVHS